MRKFASTKKGFTLIELMVALSIFIIVSIIAVSVFAIAVKNQRQAFLVQDLQDNARFIIERFSKEIRMAKSIEDPSGSQEVTSLEIINQESHKVRYKFEQIGGVLSFTRIEKSEEHATIPPSQEGDPLSNSQVKIEGEFSVINANNQQRRVTVKLLLTPEGKTEPQIRVQNTVTSRQY